MIPARIFQQKYYQSFLNFDKEIIIFDDKKHLLENANNQSKNFYQKFILAIENKEDKVEIFNQELQAFEEFNLLNY